jgi:hypothetical protein
LSKKLCSHKPWLRIKITLEPFGLRRYRKLG